MDEHLDISYIGRELTSTCIHLTNSIKNVFNLKAKQLSPPRHTRSYVLLIEKITSSIVLYLLMYV